MSGAAARRPISEGALLGAAARAAFIAANAIVSVLVARLLGPDGSGEFAVVSSLVFTLLVLGGFGIEIGVAWMLGSGRWNAGSAFATCALAALCLGIAAAGVGALLYLAASGSAFEGIDGSVALTALAGLPAGLLIVFFSQIAIATERYEAGASIVVAQALAYVAGVAALASAFELQGAVFGLLAGQVAGAAVAIGAWKRSAATGPVDLAGIRRAGAFGVKIWIANLAGILLYRFDLFLLNGYSGSAEAGYYAVAIAVAAVLVVLPSAFGSVLVPRLASLELEPTDERRSSTEAKALRHTVLIQLVSTAVMAAALPLLVAPAFGEDFGPAVEPALILLPGAAALGVSTILYSALAGRGRSDYAMWVAIGITPPAIGLYFLVIPALGADGAALASVAVYLTSAAIAWALLARLGGPGPLRCLPGRAELADYRALLARTGRAGGGS